MHRKLRTLAVAAGAAALMVPAASAAKPDHKPAKGKGQAKAKGHGKAKNAVFRGSVVSADTDAKSVVVKVTSANRWGRHLDEQEVTFTVADVKKLNVADTNLDGQKDLADVKPGDRAHVQARVAKEQASPISARKFKAQAPEAVEPAEAETQE